MEGKINNSLEYVSAIMWYALLQRTAQIKDWPDKDIEEMKKLNQRIKAYEKENFKQ